MQADALSLTEDAQILLGLLRQGHAPEQQKLLSVIDGLLALVGNSDGGKVLLAAQREIRVLKADNARAVAACTAAYRSIARFPGSVHDRAMSKLDRVVHPDKQRVYPVDEIEAEAAATEARRILIGLLALGVGITPEIEALVSEPARLAGQ